MHAPAPLTGGTADPGSLGHWRAAAGPGDEEPIPIGEPDEDDGHGGGDDDEDEDDGFDDDDDGT